MGTLWLSIAAAGSPNPTQHRQAGAVTAEVATSGNIFSYLGSFVEQRKNGGPWPVPCPGVKGWADLSGVEAHDRVCGSRNPPFPLQ